MPNSDGSIVIGVDLSLTQAEKQLRKFEGKVEETEEKIKDLTAKRDKAQQDGVFQAGVLDAEKAKLEEIKTKLREAKAAVADKTLSADIRQELKADVIPNIQQELSEQQERVRGLQSEWNATQTAVKKYDGQLLNANMELDLNKSKSGELADAIRKSNRPAERFKQHLEDAGGSVNKLGNRLKKLVSRVMVFSVFTSALRSTRSWMVNVIKTNDQATKSIAQLKGAFLTLIQPLVSVVIPAFTSFVQVLTQVVTFLASLVSAVFGTTIEESAAATENLNNEQNALKGVGSAAKKAGKDLAGFDEINKLTGETAASASGADAIAPDFSALTNLPKVLQEIIKELELKIKSLKIAWDKKDFGNKDLWIVALSGILGAVMGSMFGGITGGVLGALLGLSIGLISLVFLDDTNNPDENKSGLIVVLGAILGAVLGAKFGGLTGSIIGMMLGASIALVSLEFVKASNGDWDSKDTKIVVLSAILGAILGTVFGGFNPAFTGVGLLLGAVIGFKLVEFANNGGYNKDEAIATFRIVIFAILGTAIGTWFGGPVGAGIGLLIGLTIGFASVAFDDSMDAGVRSFAEHSLFVVLSTIIGGLLGSIFPGIGTVIGAVIGLTFGLLISFGDVSVDENGAKNKVKRATQSLEKSHSGTSVQSYSLTSIPRLAQGAVIPPNREFMAVLGDQKRGTNVEAPLATIEQALQNVFNRSGMGGGGGGGGRQITVIMQLDRQELGRAVYELNNEQTQRVGLRLAGGRL